MEALLSDYEITLKAINIFLSLYSNQDSKAQYKSAINDLLFYDTEKLDVTELTFEDYKKHIPESKRDFISKHRYKNRFFEFLYAMDFLKQPSGFETVMHKSILLKEFNKNNEKYENKSVDKKEKHLTIEELMAIQEVINIDSTKHETLKMQFCWYAIFELGLSVEEVRKRITSDNYVDGKINTSIGSLLIPEKFHQMFIDLSQRESNYNGFATLDIYIENLGIEANLERKLIPSMIKSARNNYMIRCGNCFMSYTNLNYNWRSINDRIVCVYCAEKIKKKA